MKKLTSCSQTLLQLLAVLILFFPALADTRGPHSGNVEIHYINVGQGCGTLIVGPNGTTILYDFGAVAGGKYITPYLRRELRFVPGDHIHYAIVSHGDKDHFQTPVAYALIAEERMSEEYGVDVLHIAHHGSESSTSAAYYNIMKPEVGLISAGTNQGSFHHPREDVGDRVLLNGGKIQRANSCVNALPLKNLFQTEEGVEGCTGTGCTSFSAMVVGDIQLVTDGETNYSIHVTKRFHGTPTVDIPSQDTWDFAFDESNDHM